MAKNRDFSKFPNAITVLDNGNVGINNINPSYTLDVTGTALLSGNLTANGVTIGASDIRSNSNVLTLGGTSEIIRLNSTGVGIKTSTPEVDLQIGSNANTPRTMSLRYSSVPLYMSNTWTGTYSKAVLSVNYYDTSNGSQTISSFANVNYASGSIELRSATSGSDILFNTTTSVNTAPSERVRITNAGYVGIGTAAPEGPLHIYGNVSGGYVGMAIGNYAGGTNASSGIDFGVDGSSTYNGAGNGQITVVNTNGSAGSDKSEMNLKIWNGSALVTGMKINDAGRVSFPTAQAMSAVVSSSTAITVNTSTFTTVASVTITCTGKQVLIVASGDMNPSGGPTWFYHSIFRDGTEISHRVLAESAANSMNVPFSVCHIDQPSAGSHTYDIRVSQGGGYGATYGETGNIQAPTIFAVETI